MFVLFALCISVNSQGISFRKWHFCRIYLFVTRVLLCFVFCFVLEMLFHLCFFQELCNFSCFFTVIYESTPLDFPVLWIFILLMCVVLNFWLLKVRKIAILCTLSENVLLKQCIPAPFSHLGSYTPLGGARFTFSETLLKRIIREPYSHHPAAGLLYWAIQAQTQKIKILRI
jgi:hypothetical protein